MVITCSKGVLLPTVRQPITKLQLTKNFGYHQGLLSAFLSHNTRKITRYDLLWWLDFALFDKLLFQTYLQRSIWNRLFTHQIIWANVCIFFFCQANSNLDSLACSLDSEIAQIQPGPSGSWFFFLQPKIPLALKVLQVFPGKIISWKRK